MVLPPFSVPATSCRCSSLPLCCLLAAGSIDQYVLLRVKGAEGNEEVPIDARLTAIVERMFERCDPQCGAVVMFPSNPKSTQERAAR
jgi:hypothetical protein